MAGFAAVVFVLCLLVSGYAFGSRDGTEYLDPAEMLTTDSDLEKADANKPNVQMQAVEAKQQPQAAGNDAVAVNLAAQFGDELPQSGPAAPNVSPENLARRLRQSSISAPAASTIDSSRDELARVIAKVRLLTFKPRQMVSPEPPVVVEPVVTAEPNESTADEEPPAKPGQEKAGYELPYVPVRTETLRLLTTLAEDANQIPNPFELAEVLFASGNMEEAARCYAKSLEYCTGQGEAGRMRAWILLQTGNCLRSSQPARAKQFYSTLITEYPSSLWADLARARVGLIDWYLRDKPQELIEESKQLIP